ncbi:hypothetical protein PCC6912_50810 [Chlorogloeopsis fritschii PCC 6912]|uniref:Uncharacterized protein n=1 Tax=Chlorogloeopsis fritschii PCC 6912 TaxID=211165 RepID=A0A3S1FBT7_CHLFR|nr:hypothetical protein [Chlorogloeopsis fritschii]RUR74903.1 hypothetical protein PCC6912_50810 [Chlorogloeopsis fritschii PCC 6912]
MIENLLKQIVELEEKHEVPVDDRTCIKAGDSWALYVRDRKYQALFGHNRTYFINSQLLSLWHKGVLLAVLETWLQDRGWDFSSSSGDGTFLVQIFRKDSILPLGSSTHESYPCAFLGAYVEALDFSSEDMFRWQEVEGRGQKETKFYV